MKQIIAAVLLVLALSTPALADKLDLLAIAPDGSYQELKGHPTLEASRIRYFADGIYRPVLMLGFQYFFNHTGTVSLTFTFNNTPIAGSGDVWLHPGAYSFAGFIIPNSFYGIHRAHFAVAFGNGVHRVQSSRSTINQLLYLRRTRGCLLWSVVH